MCTVTWTRSADGYDLFFNRDERKTRKPAQPPATFTSGKVRYIAPLDGDAGGTWLAVNDRGLTVAILNHYPAESSAAPGGISRGLLVLGLIDATATTDVAARLNPGELTDYRPFLLLAVDARSAALHAWDGSFLNVTAVPDDALPVSTSSFESDAVVAQRRARLAAMRTEHHGMNAELLRQYHTSREARGDPYSVLMRRPDAETVSLSHVTVRKDQIAFEYQARPDLDAGVAPPNPVVMPHA